MALMNPTVAPAPFVERDAPPTSGGMIVAGLLFLGLVWYAVINHLQAEWSYNPQYNYGWSVPILVIYLLIRRWFERPAPQRVDTRVPSIILALGALAIIPLRFLSEANPDWRLLSWTMSLIAVGVSLALVFQIGGRAWLRHFAFPVLFFLVAVPWPVQLEQAIIQNLMHLVTGINVFFLSVAGIPALQHGNLIEVRSGMIGIEEACSGVRSLQATLMVSLFLGELYSFTAVRRIVLVIAGAILAFVCNIIRTSILVWIGANRGTEAIEAWHDPAGLTILIVCLVGLWLLSLVMARRSSARNLFSSDASTDRPNRLPFALLLSLAVILIASEIGIRAWYQSHGSEFAASRWTVKWPETDQSYQRVVIPPGTQNILRYDDGGGATWSGSDSYRWMMYFFRWLPGRTAALFVKVHRPDVCLPASGLTMVQDDGIQLVEVNGIKLPVRFYRFDDHGVPLHVAYCYWDARSSYNSVNAAIQEDWTARGRIRAALNGRREVGAQMMELVVWGYEDDTQAKQELKTQLSDTVKPQT